MTKEQIKEKYNNLAIKINSRSRVSLDKDEIQDILIDSDNRIYLNNKKTPYTAEDVILIKCRVNNDEPYSIAGNSMMVIFRNGDSLRLDNISVFAFINNKRFEGRDVFIKYEIESDLQSYQRFNTWQEVIKQLETCFEKADIFAFDLQQDEDSYADIFFDEDILYISESIETPYRIADIDCIGYWATEDSKIIEQNYVRISFNNGDALYFKDYGQYEADIKVDGYFQHVRGIEDISRLFSTKMR